MTLAQELLERLVKTDIDFAKIRKKKDGDKDGFR